MKRCCLILRTRDWNGNAYCAREKLANTRHPIFMPESYPCYPYCYRPKSSRFEKIFLPANHADLRESKKSFARSAVSRRLSALGVPGVPSHRFSAASASIQSDSPRRVALQKLRQIEQTSFLLAFIRVFRGLNFGCGGAALGNPWFIRTFEQIVASLAPKEANK